VFGLLETSGDGNQTNEGQTNGVEEQ